MTTDRDPLDQMLDGLRSEALGDLPDGLEARIVADAEAVLATQVRPPSIWTRISEAIGGWPAAAGLVAAGLAGVWVGVSPPEGALALMGLGDGQAVDILGGSALFVEEG